jgi:hypothetical protein
LNFRSFRAISSGSIRRWHTPKDFSTAAIANKTGGFYTSLSPIDGIERRFAVQRFENTPLFITAGISSTAIRNEWIAGMAPHLIFGIPVTLVMFLTLFTVLRRTMHLYQEIDRRAAAEEALRQSQKLEASARTSRSRLWVGAGLWPVEADGPELESAILNLAVNARDAMPNGGKMTIEASNSYLDEVYCSQHAEAPGSRCSTSYLQEFRAGFVDHAHASTLAATNFDSKRRARLRFASEF